MFQQIPPEVVAAIIENAGEMYLNRLAERKMAQLNYELLMTFAGSAAAAGLLDEPWAEGEEGDNDQRSKESSAPNEESDRPSDDISKEEMHIKTEPSPEENDEDMRSPINDEDNNTEGAETEEREKVAVKIENSDDAPKTRRSPSGEEVEGAEKRKSIMGKVEPTSEKRKSLSRSRGSNLGDSSEVEHSETDETDDRRVSSRREQDFGSGTPERPGSDFSPGPSPFTSHQQQQQFLQASIPYLHLLPPHIRNDAARLFLMPQMLPPELAAAAAAAAAAASATTTSTSNQSPSPGSMSSSGGNVTCNNVNSTQAIPSTSSTSSSANNNSKSEKSLSGENSRSGAMFVCEPCNIKFSSAKTLDAHQTYYCSFRKDAGRESVRIEVEDVKGEMMMSVTPGSGSSSSGSKKRDRENSDEQELTMDESLESLDSFSGNKSQKTGKLYSCIYCSYSADKKVSLNRHMRMHSGLSISANQMPNMKDDQGQVSIAAVAAGMVPQSSLGSRPVTPGKSPSASVTPTPSSSKNVQEGVSAMERYCQDCDIQFSSIKTFRVHKQYYCSTRHVLKAQQSAVAAALAIGSSPSAALGKAPVELGPGVTVTPVGKSSASVGSACSPIPGEGSPVSTPGPMAGQPFVVLPTNPVIVVPYCFIQGASFLPGNVLPSQNAIIVLPNGTVQSLPGGAGGAIPIPVPSPSPQSMILGSHLMMHSPFPSASTPGPSSIMSPNNLSFPDPKEMMKLMNNSSKEVRDDVDMMSPNKLPKSSSRNSGRSSRSSEDALDHHHHQHHHHHNQAKGHGSTHGDDDGSMPAIDLTFRGIQPKKENVGGNGGDEEKENREEMCASVGSRNSRHVSRDSIPGALEENSRSRSATPAASGGHGGSSSAHHSQHDNIASSSQSHHQQRDRESPLEKMSLGSGGSAGKRTPRPSSASVSSSCSTPPALCEPKLNGMMNQIISPGGKEDPTSLNNKMVMMMLNAGAAAAAAALENSGGMVIPPPSTSTGKGKRGSVDYSSMARSSRGSSSGSGGVNGGKISPMATQLPGGAILTSASNQSLAELLMTNPPELNESLAKLNPQLLMNAHRAAAASVAAVSGNSPVGFNFNLNPAFMQALSPEIAMRLLDPTYLSTLQQSIQQQQQQQQTATAPQTSQTSQGPVKRGVSKCVECDIVFYKTENYLVHKEYYCAARTNNNSNSGGNIYPPQSKTPTASAPTSKGKGASRDNNGTRKDACRMSSCSSPSKSELDDDECISPPPPIHRKISSGSLRKSPDSSLSTSPAMISKPKSKSPQNTITNSPTSVSPVPSPKSFGVGVITSAGSKDDGKGLPCSSCGVKFSTIDNLQTHQAFYCNKRKGGINFGDNNGDKEYCGESKTGNNNGDAFMMELLASAPNSQSSHHHEKDMISSSSSSQQQQQLGLSRNKSPGPGTLRNGFLRCGKCKLPIPEEQMSTHIRVCLGTVSSSFGNGRGIGAGSTQNAGEMASAAAGGWKCPCCDVYSPTVSAAQKHLETHTGIRAFKCLLCGYRGNTLRGMRTHIRTHFDKRVFDLLEGDYMTCITANDVEPTNSTSSSNNNNNNNSNSINAEHIHRAMQSPNTVGGAINRSLGTHNDLSKQNSNGKSSRYQQDSSKHVSQNLKTEEHAFSEDGSSSDVKVFQSPSDMMMMTMMTENDSNASNGAENNNTLHYCNLCNYTNVYKANILKHMKSVHKVQIPLDMDEAEAAALMLMQNAAAAAAAAGDNDGLSAMSMIMNSSSSRGGEDDVNGDSRNSTPKSTLEYGIAQGFSISPVADAATPQPPQPPKSLSPASVTTGSETLTRSRRSASSAAVVTGTSVVPNGTTGIAEIKEEVSSLPERKCSSHSSAEDDIGKPEKHQNNKHHSHQSTTPPTTTTTPPAGGSTSGGNGSTNYCKSCDISFQYVSSFNAHKQFYCSSQASSSDTENVPERAETPVQ